MKSLLGYEEEFERKLGSSSLALLRRLPSHMQDAVAAYTLTGHPVGDFLADILSNDFVHAWGRADYLNDMAMKDWAIFLIHVMPAFPVKSWGSKEIVKAWQEMGGLRGLEKKRVGPVSTDSWDNGAD